MFVQLRKLMCVLILIAPSLAIGQSELLPLPGYQGATRQVTQLFEAPSGEPTPAQSPALKPTPTASPAPAFSDQVLQLPGTDLMKNGAAERTRRFSVDWGQRPVRIAPRWQWRATSNGIE